MRKAFNLLISFVVIAVCLFFLMTGFFGERGVFYNKSLKQYLSVLQNSSDRNLYELDNLKIYQQTLNSEQGVRDAAIALGYYIDGESVFLFEDGQVQDKIEVVYRDPSVKFFEYLSKKQCVLYSAALSFVICLICFVIRCLKNKPQEPKIQNEIAVQNNEDFIE